MLTLLSLGALAARAAGLRAGLARFWNGNALVALIVAGLVLGVLGAVIWLRHEAATAAVAGRDWEWSARLSRAQADDLKRRIARDRIATAAAARERSLVEAERDAAIERASSLEKQIDAIERASGNPVVWPRALVRELRK